MAHAGAGALHHHGPRTDHAPRLAGAGTVPPLGGIASRRESPRCRVVDAGDAACGDPDPRGHDRFVGGLARRQCARLERRRHEAHRLRDDHGAHGARARPGGWRHGCARDLPYAAWRDGAVGRGFAAVLLRARRGGMDGAHRRSGGRGSRCWRRLRAPPSARARFDPRQRHEPRRTRPSRADALVARAHRATRRRGDRVAARRALSRGHARPHDAHRRAP